MFGKGLRQLEEVLWRTLVFLTIIHECICGSAGPLFHSLALLLILHRCYLVFVALEGLELFFWCHVFVTIYSFYCRYLLVMNSHVESCHLFSDLSVWLVLLILCDFKLSCFSMEPRKTTAHSVEANGDPNKEQRISKCNTFFMKEKKAQKYSSCSRCSLNC